VSAFNVLTRRHPIVGYVNAYLYSPEIIRSFTEKDANELRFWMRSKGIGQTFVYSSHKYPFLKNPESNGGTLFLDLTQSEETLWSNLEQRCRTAIRKAKRNNLTVYIGGGAEYLRQWYAIYSNLAENRGFSVQPEKVLMGLMNKGWGNLFTAWCGGQLLGGVFFLFREYCIPLAAGFGIGPECRRYSPGNLVFWEAIKYAKEQGLYFFDFMGANDDPNHGPTKFKRSFGGEFIRIYKYSINGSPIKKWLYNVAVKSKRIFVH